MECMIFSLVLPPAELSAAGLPRLKVSDVPPCGLAPTCSRAGKSCFTRRINPLVPDWNLLSLAFFTGILQRHPVFLSTTTPIYSNAAFQILSYALESITGKPFESSLDDKVFKPLGMNASSLSEPADTSSGVIPINETASGWNVSGGDEAP